MELVDKYDAIAADRMNNLMGAVEVVLRERLQAAHTVVVVFEEVGDRSCVLVGSIGIVPGTEHQALRHALQMMAHDDAHRIT